MVSRPAQWCFPCLLPLPFLLGTFVRDCWTVSALVHLPFAVNFPSGPSLVAYVPTPTSPFSLLPSQIPREANAERCLGMPCHWSFEISQSIVKLSRPVRARTVHQPFALYCRSDVSHHDLHAFGSTVILGPIPSTWIG
ncbi:hypothetical protein BDW62DRAFT_111664 [Aspergillus aurantiobrunneus]